MNEAPYDPRALANFMLDEAERNGLALTNLASQKLLYFAHGMFLNETKRPLVKGFFEAWQYGTGRATRIITLVDVKKLKL